MVAGSREGLPHRAILLERLGGIRPRVRAATTGKIVQSWHTSANLLSPAELAGTSTIRGCGKGRVLSTETVAELSVPRHGLGPASVEYPLRGRAPCSYS